VSFILDALRKSESERQRDAGAVLSRVPIAAARPAVPIWIWVVLVLLTAAVLVLGGGWWQSLRGPETRAGLGPGATGAPAAAEARGAGPRGDESRAGTALGDDVAQSGRLPGAGSAGAAAATRDAAGASVEPEVVVPPPTPATTVAATAPRAVTAAQATVVTAPTTQTPAAPSRRSGTARGAVLTMAELVASGVELPPLTLELHVYHENPSSRFVYINGARYVEGQRLRNGPTVVEIRPIGVVLNQAGRDFLLLQQ